MGTRICCKCKMELNMNNFHFINKKLGLKSWMCKKCSKEYHANYSIENKEKLKNFYEKNKEKKLAKNRKWQKENKDKVRKLHSSEKYKKNAEKI